MTKTASPANIPDFLLSSIPIDQIEILFERCFNRAMESIEKKSAEDEILSIDEAAEFLGLERPTLYTKVSKRQIPFMKQGKRLYFSKSELTSWLKSSARKVKQLA